MGTQVLYELTLINTYIIKINIKIIKISNSMQYMKLNEHS